MNIYMGGCLSSHLGSRWHLLEAILAQDDREDRFFIDFWYHFGMRKSYKNRWKNEVIFRHPKNRVFCAGRSQRLQNGAPKGIQNQAFSGKGWNLKIVLPPARGASFRGLKGSQIAFFPGPFSQALFMLHWNRRFSDFCWKWCPREVPESFQNPSQNEARKNTQKQPPRKWSRRHQGLYFWR